MGWLKKIGIALFALIVLAMIFGGKSDTSSNSAENANTADSNQKTQKTNDDACPDLSGMKLQNYDAVMQTWVAQTTPFNSGNAKVVYNYNSISEEKRTVIYCDAGSSEGQNANWVYCGDSLRPIVLQYTDDNGVIVKKRSLEVTFDKNTKAYLATKCDTYTLI